MIDMVYLREEMEKSRRKELIEGYKYKVWQGTNGYWYTYKDEGDKKKLVKRVNRKDIEDIIVEIVDDNPTVEDIFKAESARRLELKKIGRSTYNREQKQFERFFDEFGKRKIKYLSPEEIVDFLEEQIPRFDLTAKAFSNLKTMMRQILKYAKRKKYISFALHDVFEVIDVSDRCFKRTFKEDYQEVYSEEEMGMVMRYLMNNIDLINLGILLIFVTGIRVGELVTLRLDDFINDYELKIRRSETYYKDDNHYVYEVKDMPKTQAGFRNVIIPQDYQWIRAMFRRLNPFGEYLILKNGKRVHGQQVWYRLKTINDKLGIYNKSPHKIRKTYGTILLDSGLDKRLIKDLMGHADILVTENHYHINRKSQEKKRDIVSNIPDFHIASL